MRADRQADRRRQILGAAVKVFAAKGFHAARVGDIAEEAGIAYGLVYHYFASKEHLLHGLLRGSLQEVVDDLAGADPGDDVEPAERLAALVDAYVRSFSTRLRVVTPLLLRLDLLRPEWRAEVKGLERQIVDRFAHAAGALGHPVSPRAAAFLVLGAANWTYYWYDPEGDLSVEDLARGAAAIFTGVLTKTP